MIRISVLLFTLLPLPSVYAQRVMFQPVSLKVSNSALGKGRDIGVWTVSVEMPPGMTRTRTQILMCAPQVKAIPNRTASGLLTRKAERDPRTVWSTLGRSALNLAGPTTSFIGYAQDSPTAFYVGAGITVLQVVVGLVMKQAPDAALFGAENLLPDSVDRSGEWFVVCSLGPNAQPIGPVPIPAN